MFLRIELRASIRSRSYARISLAEGPGLAQAFVETTERGGYARDFLAGACCVTQADGFGQPRKRLAVVQRIDVPAIDHVSVPTPINRLALIQQSLFQSGQHVVELRGRGRRQPARHQSIVDLPFESRRRFRHAIDRRFERLDINQNRRASVVILSWKFVR